jgi:hypothetical protein
MANVFRAALLCLMWAIPCFSMCCPEDETIGELKAVRRRFSFQIDRCREAYKKGPVDGYTGSVGSCDVELYPKDWTESLANVEGRGREKEWRQVKSSALQYTDAFQIKLSANGYQIIFISTGFGRPEELSWEQARNSFGWLFKEVLHKPVQVIVYTLKKDKR